MSRRLARLADIAYRRRGRVVLAWIVAAFVIIGVGSSLAGEYNADYNTPDSESKAASELTEQRFGGYSGQEINVALEDQSEYMTDRMPLFIAGVVGLSFLLLLVAFHPPLISLKAGVMNLLSVGAAYGEKNLVAKGGAVGELIGIDHEVPVAPFMPVMTFAILFGLSMDYEVFLISRIREEYLRHGDTS